MQDSEQRKTQNSRLVELDSLRGLAAIAVLWFHYTVIVYRFVPDMGPTLFIFQHGHYGVEFFFIISGFVIFMTLNRCRGAWDFIVSRSTRLFPTFWACMSITFIVGYFWPLPEQNMTIGQLLANITMMQEYIFVRNVDPVYWSLSYELGFYFAMFCLYLLGWLKRIDYITALWIVGAAIFHSYPQWIPHPLHYLFVINAFGHLFAAGIILFLLKNDKVTDFRISLLLFIPVVQCIQEGLVAGAIIAFFIGIFWLAINQRLAILRHRLLVFLGIISYSLYLIHHMVGFKIIEILKSVGVETNTSLIITMICSIIIASMVTFFVEKPAQKLIRNRIRQRLETATQAE